MAEIVEKHRAVVSNSVTYSNIGCSGQASFWFK